MDAPKLSPEDKKVAVAIVAVIGLALGGLFLTGVLLPWLVALMVLLVDLAKDTVALLVMAGIVIFALLNYNNIYYAMMSGVQAIRKAIIVANPVATLDTAMSQIRKKQESIATALAESRASQKRMALRIRNPAFSPGMSVDDDAFKQAGALDKAEREESLALEAKKRTRPETEITQHVVAAERYRGQAAAFQPRLDQLVRMQGMLNKAKELADSKIADMANQRDILVTTLDADKDGKKAVGLFKHVLGRSPELTMAQLSVDEIVKQSTEAEAEIDQFLEAITPQLADADLKKSAQTDAAMARFTQFTDQKALTAGPVPVGATTVKDAEVVKEMK